jgi:DNA-binding NarL/FixJ family response regulator
LTEQNAIEVLGEVTGSEELERLLPTLQLDVALADVMEGEAARLIDLLAERSCGLVLLSDGREEIRVLAENALPGWALLRRQAEGVEIAGAIHAVAAGLVAFDPALAPSWSAVAPRQGNRQDAELFPGEALTARESEVLQLMAQGLPNKTIAARLHISQHTVKFHVASILAKLGATSRTEAVTLGARRGYVLL